MTIQPPSALPPPSKGQSKKTRWGNLNMGIAKTHRIATQFVGIQLSGANVLALMVSAASIVAGTVTLAAQKYPSNWPLWLAAGVIGLGLALLIEGLTLGSLIRIRLANRAIRMLEDTIDHEMSMVLAALTIPDPAQPNARAAMRQYRQTIHLIQQDFRRKRQHATRLQRKQRRFSLPFAAMGAISSATAGGLFYHTILAGLGQRESLILAILFPLVITGTFVSSEIYKEVQEEAIKEGFGGGALTETAIREETKLRSALAVHQHVMAYLEKPEAEQAIEAGATSLLHDILAELRETSQQVTQRVLITEESGDTTRPLALAEKGGDTTSSPTQKAENVTSHGAEKRGDTTFSSTEKAGDATSPAAEKTGNATSSPTEKRGDTTFSGVKKASDTTQRPSFGASIVQERSQTAQPEQQEHTTWLYSEEAQYTEHDMLSQYDTTDTPVAHRKNQKEKRQRNTVAQSDAVPHDQTVTQRRQQPHRISKARTPAEERETTSEQDALTTQILAYLSEHDHAKQSDIAQALGITVRTVQRKLSALKQQPSDH